MLRSKRTCGRESKGNRELEIKSTRFYFLARKTEGFASTRQDSKEVNMKDTEAARGWIARDRRMASERAFAGGNTRSSQVRDHVKQSYQLARVKTI